MLLNSYFTITNRTSEEAEEVFEVHLNPENEVYKGHFPNMPIAPGVCNLQMIKECAEQILGKNLFLGEIKKCKYSALITPDKTPNLDIHIALQASDESSWVITASITKEEVVFITMKGKLTLSH